MLSNEEKAILKTAKENYGLTSAEQKILVNLIEKQFKEIEDLKANKGYHLGFIDGGIAKRYEYEDKIKAKIEEVSNGTYDAKIVLQSLFKKE